MQNSTDIQHSTNSKTQAPEKLATQLAPSPPHTGANWNQIQEKRSRATFEPDLPLILFELLFDCDNSEKMYRMAEKNRFGRCSSEG